MWYKLSQKKLSLRPLGMLGGGILAIPTTNVQELRECVVQFCLYVRVREQQYVARSQTVQLYNCTLRPMGVFVCCHFCLDAQVFHTAGARVCLFPTKGIQVQEYILGGIHFMKIHTRNEKSRNGDTLGPVELIIRQQL